MAQHESGSDWCEPDLAATCVRPATGFIPQPRLVVEVVWLSTEREDRTAKLDFCESFPGLEAVLPA